MDNGHGASGRSPSRATPGPKAMDRLTDKLSRRRARAAEEEAQGAFRTLHWLAAALFVAAGAETALRAQRSPGTPGPQGTREALASFAAMLRDPTQLAPLLTAALAAAAHAARASNDSQRARAGTRLLDGVAAGMAVAGAVRAAYNALAPERAGAVAIGRPRLAPSVVPLTFGATAVLGLILEHEERRERQALERLRRRASIVERLVPQRRTRLDRIVLHI